MAVGKKSFVLYSDLLVSIEHLTNEEKGMLFNHLLEYVNDKNPVLTDRLLITAWKPIEMQLKRDLKKFEEVKVKRSEAGKASAEARALKLAEQEQTKSTSVESVQQCSTNPTDNVNDTVNVNVNDIKNKDIPTKSDVSVNEKKELHKSRLKNFDTHCEKMLVFYNKTFGKQSKVVNQKTKDKLKKLLYDYDWADIAKAMSEVRKSKHHAENGFRWATLDFFTRPDKIEMYAFSSEAKTEYQGEDAKLVNYVANYYKS
jgi:hypothetical protein